MGPGELAPLCFPLPSLLCCCPLRPPSSLPPFLTDPLPHCLPLLPAPRVAAERQRVANGERNRRVGRQCWGEGTEPPPRPRAKPPQPGLSPWASRASWSQLQNRQGRADKISSDKDPLTPDVREPAHSPGNKTPGAGGRGTSGLGTPGEGEEQQEMPGRAPPSRRGGRGGREAAVASAAAWPWAPGWGRP